MLRRIEARAACAPCRIYITGTMSTQVQERASLQRPLLTAELTKSIWLSPETKHLEFAVNGLSEFDFAPGQFVTIRQARSEGEGP